MGRASEKRIARVRSLLLRTLSEIISSELKDPRIGIFSLTDLRLSPDLSYAEVSISMVGEVKQTEECCQVLNSAAPLLKNRLRNETDLRKIPNLLFKPDLGDKYQHEIFELIKKMPPPIADEDETGGEV